MKRSRQRTAGAATWPWARPAFLAILIAALAVVLTPGVYPEERDPDPQLFAQAASIDEQQAERALVTLGEWWRDGYACIIVDMARLMRPRQTTRTTPEWEESPGGGHAGGGDDPGDEGFEGGPGVGGAGALWPGGGQTRPAPGSRSREHPSTKIRERLLRFLEDKTGQDFGDDLGAWRRWYWNLPYAPHVDYPAIKAAIYDHADESLGQFFTVGGGATIRLDEIDWGGRPPGRFRLLDHPKHVPAAEADHVEDKHVVFGLELGGEARAYPERILSRHRLTLDRLGGKELAIVNDRLCGTVVPYASETRGSPLTFRPSGLIYRSNRLVYDEESMSLWSTIEGRPLVGPLTLHDVELYAYPIVTTRWREWKALHPDTTVLSLDTGYDIDYSRQSRFSRYLASDRLAFEVPQVDDRLETKEPVLALVLRQAGGGGAGARRALAIRSRLLTKKQNRVYHQSFAGHELVIVTSRDGAHRVYDAGETRFVAEDADGRLRDASGGLWRLSEAALTPEAPEASPKVRLPARSAFWFAWYAQFPDTELVE